MPEESNLITTYRNRVLSISACLMVYAIAGGSVSTVEKDSAAEVTLFGVKLLFSRPSWLIWAALILLLYFWWRHYQLTTNNNNRFYDEVYGNITISSSIVDKIKLGDSGSDDIVQTDYDYGIEVKRGDVTREDVECHRDNIVFVKKLGFARYELTMFKLSSYAFDYHVKHGSLNYFNTYADTIRFETKRLVDRVQMFLLHSKALLYLSLKSPDFTDAILPDILTAMAIVIVVVNSIM